MSHTPTQLRRVTITLPDDLLRETDAWLADSGQENRSRLMQVALKAYLKGLRRHRLAAEAQKLATDEEEALAEEALGASNDVWPEY